MRGRARSFRSGRMLADDPSASAACKGMGFALAAVLWVTNEDGRGWVTWFAGSVMSRVLCQQERGASMAATTGKRGEDRNMPVYRLTPIETNHANWSRSTHNGPCLVHANDEQEARQLAARKFGIAAESSIRQPDGTLPTPPWKDPTLVACDEVSDNPPSLSRGEVRPQ